MSSFSTPHSSTVDKSKTQWITKVQYLHFSKIYLLATWLIFFACAFGCKGLMMTCGFHPVRYSTRYDSVICGRSLTLIALSMDRTRSGGLWQYIKWVEFLLIESTNSSSRHSSAFRSSQDFLQIKSGWGLKCQNMHSTFWVITTGHTMVYLVRAQ